MARRPPEIVLSAPGIPDQAGLFRGVRRWLDRDPDVRVRVHWGFTNAQARSLSCDGLITDRGPGTEALLRRAPFPIVSVAGRSGTDDQYFVAVDEHAVGRMAADHFREQGHWQFACVTYGSGEIGWDTQREQGFAERLAEAGRSYAPLHVDDLPRDRRSPHIMAHNDTVRRRAIAAFVKALPKPLAVFAGDDLLAIMVAGACEHAGLGIPADVALLGVNNDPLCQLFGPPLSSVALPSDRVGYEAMATISALVNGREDMPRRTLLPPLGVVVRPSSDALQVRDPVVGEALRYIRDDPRGAIGVKELAARVGMSRRALERRFRHAVGRTPGEEVQRLRSRLWRRLLTDTDLSMAEISQRCGFGAPATFAAAVRRAEGLAPSAYRQKARGSKVSDST